MRRLCWLRWIKTNPPNEYRSGEFTALAPSATDRRTASQLAKQLAALWGRKKKIETRTRKRGELKVMYSTRMHKWFVFLSQDLHLRRGGCVCTQHISMFIAANKQQRWWIASDCLSEIKHMAVLKAFRHDCKMLNVLVKYIVKCISDSPSLQCWEIEFLTVSTNLRCLVELSWCETNRLARLVQHDNDGRDR